MFDFAVIAKCDGSKQAFVGANYDALNGKTVVLLLFGGDKSTQKKDILRQKLIGRAERRWKND